MGHAKQSADEVRIAIDPTHLVVLESIQKADLTSNDFLFL
jgi:hypothetical protein